MGGFKDKILSLLKTSTTKQAAYGKENKLSNPKTQKQSEENKTNSFKNSFIILIKKIKDRIITDTFKKE